LPFCFHPVPAERNCLDLKPTDLKASAKQWAGVSDVQLGCVIELKLERLTADLKIWLLSKCKVKIFLA
jgi:hypothetical protein